MQVSIKVIDVDDNAPEFSSVSKVNVSEDTAVGQPVVIFNATDKDTDKSFRYSILSGNIGNKFSIDTKTGKIWVSI